LSAETDLESLSPEELRRIIGELRAAVAARDEFISIAAHELRNPMTPILMQIDLLQAALQKGSAGDRIAEGLKRLERAIEKYIDRATILLDVSRITSGKLWLVPVPVDLSALVRRVAEGFEAAAARADCRLELAIDEGVAANCDPLAIEQVLENLLSNAIKFGAGKPVEIRLAAGKGAGADARLRVRDHGPGISAEDRARLFERFEQTVIGRERRGFGIGLWLVGQLVAAMGGTVEVESRPGEGAAFTVWLPCGGGPAEREDEGR
jgi:signal transduction histidine kinase